jgi:hypothetical protein
VTVFSQNATLPVAFSVVDGVMDGAIAYISLLSRRNVAIENSIMIGGLALGCVPEIRRLKRFLKPTLRK